MPDGKPAAYADAPAQHLAQVNVSRLLAPLTSEQLAGFVQASDPVHGQGAATPGFVWRAHTVTPPGSRTRAFAWEVGDSAGVVVNLTVWESPEALQGFVHSGLHLDALRRRREWFARHPEASSALWWVPVGHRPRWPEAEERLRHLRAHGATAYAFELSRPFPPVRADLVAQGDE